MLPHSWSRARCPQREGRGTGPPLSPPGDVQGLSLTHSCPPRVARLSCHAPAFPVSCQMTSERGTRSRTSLVASGRRAGTVPPARLASEPDALRSPLCGCIFDDFVSSGSNAASGCSRALGLRAMRMSPERATAGCGKGLRDRDGQTSQIGKDLQLGPIANDRQRDIIASELLRRTYLD